MADFIQNSLNQYETYTYNIRLFMVSPSDFGLLETAIGTRRTQLIADNARIAKYNISSLEQTSAFGHNLVREAFESRFDMVVQEANGVTLLSTIKNASLELGIPNHIQAGYFIVVEFHGRDSSGRPKKHPQEFIYPVTISDFTFKVTEGGTTYNITFVAQGSSGYRYLNNTVKEQVTIVAQTVGEFVDNFQEQLNESILELWAANEASGEYPDTYRFEFDETTSDWRDWRFEALDKEFEVQGVEFIGRPGENPSLQITVNNGSQITSVFSMVLQMTAEYKRILVAQKDFGKKYAKREPRELATEAELDSFPVFLKVLSNVEYGKFDRLIGQYSKTIVYRLKAYSVSRIVLDQDQYRRGITNSNIQSRRINNLISQNLLRKRYDYFYTGKNTEILELDMDFNLSYYEVQAYGGGYAGDPRVQSPQFLKDKPEVIGRFENLRQARSEVARAQKDLNRLIDTVSIGRNVGPFSIEVARERLQASRDRLNSVIDEESLFLNEEYGLSAADIAFYMRWSQDVISGQDMYTSDNDKRGGNLKFGAVKVNLENSADFQTIEMGIRGDPYWLGNPNSLEQQKQTIEDLADYEAGGVNFFLQVNFPSTEEDRDGRRKPRPDYQLSGVFQVTSVINQYRNGQFVQYLKAVRDMGTNPPTVWDRLAGDNSAVREQIAATRRQEELDAAQAQENARARTGPQ